MPTDTSSIDGIDLVKRDLTILDQSGEKIPFSDDQALIFEYQAVLRRAVTLAREIRRRGLWP